MQTESTGWDKLIYHHGELIQSDFAAGEEEEEEEECGSTGHSWRKSIITVGIEDMHEGSELLLCPRMTWDCFHQVFDVIFGDVTIIVSVKQRIQEFLFWKISSVEVVSF